MELGDENDDQFSDETIKAAQTMWFEEAMNLVNGVQADWRAAAAVFEAAANEQVDGNKQPARSSEGMMERAAQDAYYLVHYKDRAGRAVAAIERAIPVIKAKLEGAHPGSTICLARDIAEALGLTITPARELTVTWNKEN